MSEIVARLYLLAGGLLFLIGFYGLLASAELLRRILGLNIMGSGVFLVFVAIALQTDYPKADPVPHAMVLTGIIVSVCGTGLALALLARIQTLNGRKREE
jgi:multicomponent Na+:H+ antiporter subunit C